MITNRPPLRWCFDSCIHGLLAIIFFVHNFGWCLFQHAGVNEALISDSINKVIWYSNRSTLSTSRRSTLSSMARLSRFLTDWFSWLRDRDRRKFNVCRPVVSIPFLSAKARSSSSKSSCCFLVWPQKFRTLQIRTTKQSNRESEMLSCMNLSLCIVWGATEIHLLFSAGVCQEMTSNEKHELHGHKRLTITHHI